MATNVPSITALSEAPNRATDSAAEFAGKADTTMSELVTLINTNLPAFIAAVNALGIEIDSAILAGVTAVNAPGTSGTSTTSLAIGTGSKALTTQTAKSWAVGQPVVVASTASPTNFMAGVITAYNSGTGAMTVSVVLTSGSGTLASWNVALCGPVLPLPAEILTTGGTTTAYTITPTVPVGSYVAGQAYDVNFNAACGASPTLTISAVGSPPNLVKQLEDGTFANLEASDIPAAHRSRVILISASQALVVNMPTAPDHGLFQCRLAKSGANLVLSRAAGNRLLIGNVNRLIPSAGVTLAPTALTANTTYFVYAYMSGSTMTLEASTTAHATDATWGHEVKSGDTSRTLVGMARIGSVAATFTDTAAQRFVASYYSRRDMRAQNGPQTVSAIGTTGAERTTTSRAEFVTWGDESVAAGIFGSVTDTASSPVSTIAGQGFDGALTSSEQTGYVTAVNGAVPVAAQHGAVLSEGYHYSSTHARSGSTATGAITATNWAQLRG